jgi:hypothetical protein
VEGVSKVHPCHLLVLQVDKYTVRQEKDFKGQKEKRKKDGEKDM